MMLANPYSGFNAGSYSEPLDAYKPRHANKTASVPDLSHSLKENDTTFDVRGNGLGRNSSLQFYAPGSKPPDHNNAFHTQNYLHQFQPLAPSEESYPLNDDVLNGMFSSGNPMYSNGIGIYGNDNAAAYGISKFQNSNPAGNGTVPNYQSGSAAGNGMTPNYVGGAVDIPGRRNGHDGQIQYPGPSNYPDNLDLNFAKMDISPTSEMPKSDRSRRPRSIIILSGSGVKYGTEIDGKIVTPPIDIPGSRNEEPKIIITPESFKLIEEALNEVENTANHDIASVCESSGSVAELTDDSFEHPMNIYLGRAESELEIFPLAEPPHPVKQNGNQFANKAGSQTEDTRKAERPQSLCMTFLEDGTVHGNYISDEDLSKTNMADSPDLENPIVISPDTWKKIDEILKMAGVDIDDQMDVSNDENKDSTRELNPDTVEKTVDGGRKGKSPERAFLPGPSTYPVPQNNPCNNNGMLHTFEAPIPVRPQSLPVGSCRKVPAPFAFNNEVPDVPGGTSTTRPLNPITVENLVPTESNNDSHIPQFPGPSTLQNNLHNSNETHPNILMPVNKPTPPQSLPFGTRREIRGQFKFNEVPTGVPSTVRQLNPISVENLVPGGKKRNDSHHISPLPGPSTYPAQDSNLHNSNGARPKASMPVQQPTPPQSLPFGSHPEVPAQFTYNESEAINLSIKAATAVVEKRKRARRRVDKDVSEDSDSNIRGGTAGVERRKSGRRRINEDALTEEERERLTQKREKNREAAARCRKKKVDKIQSLEEELHALREEQKHSRQQLQEFEKQRKALELMLSQCRSCSTQEPNKS